MASRQGDTMPSPSRTVADGTVAVPETWGDEESVALKKLRDCDLVAGERILEPSSSVAGGTVFGTIPRAGTEVARGHPVAYVVAGASLGTKAEPTAAGDREQAAGDQALVERDGHRSVVTVSKGRVRPL